MSDHDPIDRAYRDAEAILDDEEARAIRRARVLAALSPEALAKGDARKRNTWIRPTAWLAAASIAGLSVLTALQFNAPISVSTKPAAETAPSAPVDSVAAPTAPPVTVSAPPATAVAEAQRAEAFSPPISQAPPALEPAPPPAPPPPPAPSSAAGYAAESVAPPPALAPPPPAAAPRPTAQARAAAPARESRMAESADLSSGSSEVTSAKAEALAKEDRLRAAAAAGRVNELTSLLDDGAAIDAPDPRGETALMKAVQARRPAAAALLRRNGASLDRPNRAGLSARDMARALGDPLLNEALGLAP